jgi:hypothetical protein
LRNGDQIRFYPRPGFASRMVGGVFESGDGSFIYTITKVPPDGWSEVNVDFGTATVLRYRSPDGGYGNVAEIEFYRSGAKVIAAADGTPGSWSGKDKDTFKAAFDGNTSTFFDALQSNGAFVQVDTGFGTDYALSEGFDQLMLVRYLNFPSTTESHRAGERVYVFSYTPPPTGYYFAGWEGFIDILDDPSATSTMATMPGTGTKMRLAATYKPVPPGSSILTVYRGSGSGVYPAGTMVAVSADPPSTGQQFAGWTGDIAILSNPFITTTTAIVPSMDTSIFANYDASGLSDKIRFFPRAGYAERMIGGVFEGTNGDSIGGPYKTIYIIASKPSEGWSEVNARLDQINLSEYTPYRYLRYRAPNGSYGNVAEIEFYRQGQKLTGAGYGTAGSWNGLGASFDKALDGKTSTFFNAPTSDGAYVGVDTNSDGTLLGDSIKYYPRAGRAERMVGGVFEGTTGDPVSGPYTTIYTITSVPPLEWNVVRVDLGNYRYLRYRGPDGSYGNVAEVGFYRNGAKLTGQGFGTSGSWSGSGSTFDKALDGDVNTFFDAPSANGVYVGIGMY